MLHGMEYRVCCPFDMLHTGMGSLGKGVQRLSEHLHSGDIVLCSLELLWMVWLEKTFGNSWLWNSIYVGSWQEHFLVTFEFCESSGEFSVLNTIVTILMFGSDNGVLLQKSLKIAQQFSFSRGGECRGWFPTPIWKTLGWTNFQRRKES